ncbi:MAG: TonB-dependent receptor [Burkholderiales bacterium]|nr:TonB-dependent receptor [Burkholderiales bacterium]
MLEIGVLAMNSPARAAAPLVCATLAALFGAAPAAAQDADEGVVVSATRTERRNLEIPGSVDVVGARTLREGKPMVNLSESLGGVPGLRLQNRQNYAQDLQLSIRGFGARAPFGIRGVKLYADGIPATMPDGQGQAANFNLSTAQRIEVMRGPLAGLYGNASGGVINLYTADGPRRPTLSGDLLLGEYGTRRAGVQAGGESGALNYIADWSQFHTDGYREHSAADRQQFNGKLKWLAGGNTRLSFVINTLYQPETQDPLGLTGAQASDNPRQVAAPAILFDTRKTVRQEQAGATIEQRLGAGDLLRASLYLGDRQVRQYQSIPLVVQSAPTASGGVVDLGRQFGGLSLNWIHDGTLAGRPLSFTGGLEQETMQERRRGYINFFGALGALKRDEDDRVESSNLFAQADWRYTERASVSLGLRRTLVRFDSRDYYIVGANPDDSGGANFSNTSPVAGLAYRLAPELSLYASAGRGFETPTFTELAYRASGTGLNFDLKPSLSTNAEIGLKGRIAEDHRIALAYFDTTTHDEIVVDTAAGGRTIYKNAGRTRRTGWEASWQAVLPANFDAQIAYTLIDARYDEAFTSGSAALSVPAGNKLPGVARTSLYAELQWRHFETGFSAALEGLHNSRVYVDDQNSDAAAAYTIGNLRLGFEQKKGDWRIAETLRIDNFTDRAYIGSVIVADGNGRFFEPALPRNFSLLVSARLAF